MSTGRKRKFDKGQALEQAMTVFWQKGYIGTSMADLTDAMGINKPSMYAAFGNKEELYLAARRHYLATIGQDNLNTLFGAAPLPERLQVFLETTISSQHHKDCPRGCYISASLSEFESGELPPHVAEVVKAEKNMLEDVLIKFFEEESAQGSLPDSFDIHKAARFLVAFVNGASTMARCGKNKEEILSLAPMALVGIGLEP